MALDPMAKYGLSIPSAGRVQETTTQTAASKQTITEEPQRKLEIVKIDSRITETNESWSRFAWRLTVKNLSSTPVLFEAVIEFQDAVGFAIDEAREFRLDLSGHEERAFTGNTLIRNPGATRVSQVNAKLRGC